MRRVRVLLAFIVALSVISAQALALDYEKDYFLSLPELKLAGEDYEAGLESYQVKLHRIDTKTFLLSPSVVKANEKWVRSAKETDLEGWICKIRRNERIKISGLMIRGFYFAIFELVGVAVSENAWKGKAVIHMGIGQPGETPFVYRSEWALEKEGTGEPVGISKRVTYQGPSVPPPRVPETSSQEERAKRPLQSDRSIRTMAGYAPKEREKLINSASRGLKEFYEKILAELIWEEIKYTPGILLLIDHLADLEKGDQKRIANAYVRDGTVDLFGDIPYEELQRVPPLFLIIFRLDRIQKIDIQGLIEVSPRFRELLRAYKEIPKEEVSELALSEFVLRIYENLSPDHREDFYQRSAKLRRYLESVN